MGSFINKAKPAAALINRIRSLNQRVGQFVVVESQ